MKFFGPPPSDLTVALHWFLICQIGRCWNTIVSIQDHRTLLWLLKMTLNPLSFLAHCPKQTKHCWRLAAVLEPMLIGLFCRKKEGTYRCSLFQKLKLMSLILWWMITRVHPCKQYQKLSNNEKKKEKDFLSLMGEVWYVFTRTQALTMFDRTHL